MQRFQIEDLVVQDESGVVFRAFDSQTDQTVALRRFFPRGADGGGLSPDEQIAYQITLERLVGIHHPSLRSVICGGCDPVDGMPFIATEWIEGTSISENTPLASSEAADLLGKALEVCQVLSEALAEEAVWVETDLQTIIRGAQESGRGVTFWISPFKWLGDGNHQRGLESVIGLTEEIMGWKGRLVADQQGQGLGGWLRWLRGAAKSTSLRAAQETLAASLGVKPPAAVKRPVPQAGLAKSAPPQAAATNKKPRSRIPLVLFIASLLVSLGVGGWRLSRPIPAAQPSQTPNSLGIMDFSDFKLDAIPSAASQPAAAAAPTVRSGADVFSVTDQDALMRKNGEEVIFEGTFRKISFSSSRKTMYLLFSENASSGEPRGGILLSSAAADITEDSITPLTGKKVRLQGKLKVESLPKPGRPVIFITNRAAIQQVE